MTLTYPSALVNDLKPVDLVVVASASVPWRNASIRGAALDGMVAASMGTQEDALLPVFLGQTDEPGATVRELGQAKARGLPDWRREVGPKSFQDVRLETLLAWIGGACGGLAQLGTTGTLLRHYVLRKCPAHTAVREALASWRNTSTLLELDGGVLYIGPEASSPHATAGTMFRAVRGENILSLTTLGGGGYLIVLPLMPQLRLGHRGEIDHPLVSGPARVVSIQHIYGEKNLTSLEVQT